MQQLGRPLALTLGLLDIKHRHRFAPVWIQCYTCSLVPLPMRAVPKPRLPCRRRGSLFPGHSFRTLSAGRLFSHALLHGRDNGRGPKVPAVDYDGLGEQSRFTPPPDRHIRLAAEHPAQLWLRNQVFRLVAGFVFPAVCTRHLSASTLEREAISSLLSSGKKGFPLGVNYFPALPARH